MRDLDYPAGSMQTSVRDRALQPAVDAEWSQGEAADPRSPRLGRGGDIQNLLTRMVEGEIIPRLLMAHQNGAPSVRAVSSLCRVDHDTVDAFTDMVLQQELDDLVGYSEGLVARGVPVSHLYTDLLAPTARRLGEFWDRDEASFTDVTIGLGRLQQVLHHFCRDGDFAEDDGGGARSGLFATVADEQHTFGVLMVEELFRRSGWRTRCELGSEPGDLARVVSTTWYDLFGIGVSCDAHLDQVAATIKRVRRHSRNRSICIMVGGSLFHGHPDLGRVIGADITATQGADAVAIASSMIGRIESRR